MSELPKGWIIVKIEDAVEILDNLRVPVSAKERAKRSGSIPYYGANGQAGWIDDYIFNEPLVLLGEDGAPFFDSNKNVAYPISGKSWVNNHAHVLKVKNEITINSFILHFFNQLDYTGYVGGTTRLKLTQGSLKKIKIPLPPLNEQKRIVEKLDRLFANLDSLKTRLDHIPQLLKQFRQSVLTQAVTGKLTEEWREGKSLPKTEIVPLSELIVDKPRNGYSPKGVEYETDVKSMALSATTSGYFNPRYVKFLDITPPVEDSHLWLKKGDILIQRSNTFEYVGVSAIYTGEDSEFIYPDLMMKITTNERVINTYLQYVLSFSDTRDYFRANATGTAGNMPKINQKVVLNTPIALPTIKEQQEVVRRVEALFAITDNIEERYLKLKAQIEHLPQAILAKAFRGKLVPQDPNDEPAEELLNKIEEQTRKTTKQKQPKNEAQKTLDF